MKSISNRKDREQYVLHFSFYNYGILIVEIIIDEGREVEKTFEEKIQIEELNNLLVTLKKEEREVIFYKEEGIGF